MYAFKNSVVVIPITVIEELDTFKKHNDERGRAARHISRTLNNLMAAGKLAEGVKIKNGSILRIAVGPDEEFHPPFLAPKSDNRILGLALELQKKGDNVVFITKDINLRIKAEVLGLNAQDYEKEKVKVEELYRGWSELEVDDADIDKFYSQKSIALSGDFLANECVILKNKTGTKSAIGKYNAKEKKLQPLFHQNIMPWGLKPLNVHQKFALEVLLCNDINLVTLIGVPGAGKTLLALACGLQKVVEEKYYKKLFIARPVIPMGRDIGYLPGTKEEKLSSWMGAIYDNLEFLFEKKSPGADTMHKFEYLFDAGLLEIEALTYMRGRSLPGQYIIIDDAQNLTPHEIKTIISRAGTGTKIVFTGDPYQIDNPYLDASSNGLTNLVERFKGQEIFGHLTFEKTERSKLSALASELL